MLCYRCEHRARFHEEGSRPRHECGDTGSKIGCYMYQPVKPLVLKKQGEDPRPEYGGYFGARQEGVRIADVELALKKIKDGSFVYWKPKEKESGSN